MDSGGEKAGERGEVVGELTVVQFEAEDGRERELGVEVEARRRTSMVAAAGVPDSAVVGLDRAHGGVEEVRGKAMEVGARRIELRRRVLAGASSGGGFARFCSLELEEGKGMDWTGNFQGQREEKNGVGARWPTRGGSPPATVAGMGGARHRGEISGAQGNTVTCLTIFDPILIS